MKSRLTGRLRRVIAARCNCERAVQRLNPLPLFAPVLVSIAGPPPRAVPHTPSSPLQLPPRGDGAAVARGERIVPPLLDTLSSRLDCRIEGERKAGAIVSFGHRRQSPPTFLSPVGKKISSFNRASGLLAWLMAGKVRGKFHHRIQIVGGNLWRARTN